MLFQTPTLKVGFHNLRHGYYKLNLVFISDLFVADYGKFLTMDEIHSLVAPAPYAVDAVVSWLKVKSNDNPQFVKTISSLLTFA